MSANSPEISRIFAEYERRGREIRKDFYSWARPSNLLQHEQFVRGSICALQQASLFPLDGCRVADIGCGTGLWLVEFLQWGADPGNLAGIDLLPERIGRARRRLPEADLQVGSASALPWPDESFDLVSQFTVFTSILDAGLKHAIAEEMLRVLKPGGAILWNDFRFNNPRNPNVRGVRVPEIRSLFPDCTVRLSKTVLAAPLSRAVTQWSWHLGSLLGGVPFLCSHYTGLIQKRRRRG